MNAINTKPKPETKSEKYSPADLERFDALRKRVIEYKDGTGSSWEEIFRKTGIKPGTLQPFVSGKYEGNLHNVAGNIERWFRSEETQELFSKDISLVPVFAQTRTARHIYSMLKYARNGNIVTIQGHPGVGKTIPLENFATEYPNTWMITAAPSSSSAHTCLLEVLKALNDSSHRRNIYEMSQAIRSRFKHRDNCLLIVDESQHLTDKALEEFRAIHDDTKVGVAFVGNMEVTRNIEGNRTAQYAQRYSRVSMRHTFKNPHADDVRLLLDRWDVADQREADFLTAIAMKTGGGALRSMTKCLELASILARDFNDGAPRNLTHLKDAWDQLTAGGVA